MATTTADLVRTSIDLPESTRAQVIELLNARLADTLALKTHAKQAHWNVKGKDFFQLHELFDEVATHLEADIDLIAERVTALGGVARGSVHQAANATTIEDYRLGAAGGEDHLRELVKRMASYGAQVRQGIDRCADAGDQSSADLLTEISREVDKDLWFLEAHLQ